MENKKDTTVTINVTRAKEKAKKAFKTILILAFFIAAYMIICRPQIMGNILTRTEKATAISTKTKEIENIYVINGDYVVMYGDNSYAKAENINNLAIELTDSTGKQYAEDSGRLKMFDGGKIVDVTITTLKS